MTDSLADYFAQRDQANRDAEAVYAALKKTGRLKDHRVLSYRCVRRCLLLELIVIPAQVIVHQPRYKLSPVMTDDASSAGGRRANTEDGYRRWKERTYDVGSALNFTLTCDHLNSVILDKSRVQRDLDARRGRVIVTPADSDPPPATVSWTV